MSDIKDDDTPIYSEFYEEEPPKDNFIDTGDEKTPSPVEDSKWNVRITVIARRDIPVSQTQTMSVENKHDVTDNLTETQLAHILDCIQPTN